MPGAWCRSATPACRSGRRARPTTAYFTDAGGIIARQRRQRVRHQGRQGDRCRAGRATARRSTSPSTATSGSATSRWWRSGPTPCSARRRCRSRPPVPARVDGRSRWAAPRLPTRSTPRCRTSAATSSDLDKPQFEQALQTLTDTLRDATPQLRGALDGVANAVAQPQQAATRRSSSCWPTPSRSPTCSAQRAGQVNQLITDGNQLFAALDERRQALSDLIAGIDDVSQQLSGFVADNQREFGPALEQAQPGAGQPARAQGPHRRGAATGCRRTPPRSARWSAPGPGFQINLYGLPPRHHRPRCCSTSTSSPASCRTASPTTCAGCISERTDH